MVDAKWLAEKFDDVFCDPSRHLKLAEAGK